MTRDRLLVAAPPHIHGPDSVATIMWNVVGSLVPLIVAAFWFFGVSALLVVAASVLGAVVVERAQRVPLSGRPPCAVLRSVAPRSVAPRSFRGPA